LFTKDQATGVGETGKTGCPLQKEAIKTAQEDETGTGSFRASRRVGQRKGKGFAVIRAFILTAAKAVQEKQAT